MSEITGYIETTKIQPVLEDLTITPSKQEQNFKSKVDGYDKIRVNAIPCETLNVTPKREKQAFEGIYGNVNVDAIQTEILNVVPKKESQYFDGLYEKIYVDKITGDTLTITPLNTQQTFNGLYENVNVESVSTEEITIDPDFSLQDTFEVTAAEGKYINKATINKDADLLPENILNGNNIYGIKGTFEPLDTSDATATAGDITKDKTAYVNGEKVIGTMEVKGYNAILSTENLTTFKVSQAVIEMDMNGVDTSKITSFQNAYSGCSNLKTIKGEMDCSSATTFANMFYNSSSLQTFSLKNTDKVNSMSSMCNGCSNLINVPFFNTNLVTVMNNAFSGCNALVDVPLFNTSSITSTGMQNTFYNCTSLSDESLNNILAMCTNATKITTTSAKTLKYVGLTSAQATRCQSLSNYQAFLDAGWTTGF